MQGLGWEAGAEVREHSTPLVSMDLPVQYAQRKGDVYRRRHQEQRDEDKLPLRWGKPPPGLPHETQSREGEPYLVLPERTHVAPGEPG